jgi:putative iron-regulated protein
MKQTFGCVLFLSLVLSGCKKDEDESMVLPSLENPVLTAAKAAAVETYAAIVLASYQDALTTAQELEQAIDQFVSAPTQSGLDLCRQAWLAARQPYGQTEVYRFYGGPIDDEDGPEGLLNAWPMDEAYVDYVAGNPSAGIINDPVTYPTIDEALLTGLNEAGGETNISTGYHAIEFLLWGQDLSTSGPGARAFTDYTTAPNAQRRGQYLLVCAQLLTAQLQDLVNEWAVGASYRTTFLANPNAALTSMLQGIGFMGKGELAGERMFVAWDTQDQEDEHSCFSDNTHNDILANAQGMYNVWQGTYTRVDGTELAGAGLASVLEVANSSVGTTTTEAVVLARDLCATIPAPFDQQILGGDQNGEVYQSILALRSAGDAIASAASALGLSITVE